MPEYSERQTGAFSAVDAMGRRYEITEVTESESWRTLAGERYSIDVRKRLATADGRMVKRVSQGEYDVYPVEYGAPIVRVTRAGRDSP